MICIKTSENHEVVIASDASASGTGALNDYNGITFYQSGDQDTLDNDTDFTQTSGIVIKNGEEFYEYTHVDYGTVLIEADIKGAATGGL